MGTKVLLNFDFWFIFFVLNNFLDVYLLEY